MKYIKIKKLMYGLKQKGGRSNRGLITTKRRGSLTKKLYRYLDIKRTIWSNEGSLILYKYIYDPNRSAYITLLMLPNGIMTYILAGQYEKTQEKIYNLTVSQFNNIGYSQILKKLKNGSIIFNNELFPSKGAQLLKSAGTSGVILKKLITDTSKIVLKLKSGALHSISSNAMGCVGMNSNQNHFLKDNKKAGTIRLKGRRSYVRPSAMNPVIILWVVVQKEVFIHKIKIKN